MNFPIAPLGKAVGGVTEEMAARTGLKAGTPVSSSIIDAHVAMPSAGITGPGQLLAIMGTSTCDILLSEEERFVPGICGVVDGGVYPGFYAYEAGQSCVGDHFAWFVDHCCPASYKEDADRQGKNLHVYLTELAEKLRPGESGLVALDWWNGQPQRSGGLRPDGPAGGHDPEHPARGDLPRPDRSHGLRHPHDRGHLCEKTACR